MPQWLRMISWGVLGSLVFGAGRPAAGQAGRAPLPEGSWIGWAFLGEAGDLPLRFEVHSAGGRLKVTFDSPAHRSYRRLVPGVQWNAPVLRLQWASAGGSPIVVEGRVTGETIQGSISWAEASGTFELTHSPLAIAQVDPKEYADAAGFYQRAPGDVVELSPRPWGEMLYRERRTGRVRTLLPLGPDSFFIGSAMYLPSPIEGYVRLERGADGRVGEIIETEPGAAPRQARRLEIREESVEFPSGAIALKGTLLIPVRTHRLPGVVVLGGSSWKTRDDVAFRARSLAALGFVVLSFDQRGFGESGGEPVVPFDTTARDALAAVHTLRQRPEVDSAAVGLFGASRGGWIAPLAASFSSEARFLILLVPPAVSPAEQETKSRVDRMRAAGFSTADLALAERLLAATWRYVRSADNWSEYADLRQEAVARKFPEYVLEAERADSRDWRWAQLNMFFEPCPVLSRVRVPVLGVFGGKDLQVSEPVNRPRLLECLARGGNTQVAVYTIPGVGHDLSLASDLRIHRWGGGGDEGFSTIADWALQRFVALRW